MNTVQTPKAPKAVTPKAVTPKAVTPKAPKAKKSNELKDARKEMLGKVREERMSFSDCQRLIAMFGAKFLKAVGLTPKEFKALTPNDLRPFQLEKERYKAVLNESGELDKVETGWTPVKLANAIERKSKGAKA